jgi:hypothetical protein
MKKPDWNDDPYGFNQPAPARRPPDAGRSAWAKGGKRGTFHLYVDVIPSSAWFSNLRKELSPEEWKACQKYAFKKGGYCCDICEEKGPKWPVECHERWEFDEATGVQRLTALEALCPDCHEATHMGLAMVRGRQAQAMAKISKVNGWSLEQVKAHVRDAGVTYERLSERPWLLDLSLLKALPVTLSEKTKIIVERHCDLADKARQLASRPAPDGVEALREAINGPA